MHYRFNDASDKCVINLYYFLYCLVDKRGPIMLIFWFHILCLYCDMYPCFFVQKGLYFSHTACAAGSLVTLRLKPEPSLL